MLLANIEYQEEETVEVVGENEDDDKEEVE